MIQKFKSMSQRQAVIIMAAIVGIGLFIIASAVIGSIASYRTMQFSLYINPVHIFLAVALGLLCIRLHSGVTNLTQEAKRSAINQSAVLAIVIAVLINPHITFYSVKLTLF